MAGFIFSGGAGAGAVGSSTVTATGTTTARSLADRFADTFNVKDFGALGNSTTGVDGQDDTTYIQAAINALGTDAGTVYFPPGMYRITSPIFFGRTADGGSNKSICLLGCGNKSEIVGNFDGYIIDKGMVRVATNGTTSTSSNVLHFADTSSLGLQAGYSIINKTTPASLSPYPTYRILSFDATSVTMVNVDDTTPHNAAATVGNGDIIEFVASTSGGGEYVRKISQLFIKNTHATGGGIRFVGSWPAQIRDCYIQATYCVSANENSAVDVANCKIEGNGNAGYGIAVGGECTVYKCDITSVNGPAVYAGGTGGSIIGCRMEINTGYAVQLVAANGWLVAGNSMEGNGGGIYCGGAGSCLITSNAIHGEEEHGSFAGLTIPSGGSANYTLISGLSVSGTFGTATPSESTGHGICVGFGNQGLMMQGCNSGVTGGHGVNWLIHAEDCAQYVGCINRPYPSTQTYANKPGTTGGGPIDGDLHTFVDCPGTAVATCTAGTITGNTTFTVAGTLTGSFQVGDVISGTNVTSGTTITGISGTNTYTCTSSTNATATTITGSRVLFGQVVSGGGTNVVVARYSGNTANWRVVAPA